MRRYILANPMIRSAGYDAQRQVLEMEFASDGQICQFDNVPEEIWYRFRSHQLPALFFQHFIMGHYPERKMQEIGQKTRAYRKYSFTEGNIITEYRNIEVKAAGIGISAAAFKVLHKSLSQKSGICYTVTEVLSDGRKDFEIGRETQKYLWQENFNRQRRMIGGEEYSG